MQSLSSSTHQEAIKEVKRAVDSGKMVYWKNMAYPVMRDSLGQYFIIFTLTQMCHGLTNAEETRLSGEIAEFYIEEKQHDAD